MTIWLKKPSAALVISALVLLVAGCTVKKPEEELSDPPGAVVLPDPVLVSISSPGPSNNNNPIVTGTADASVTVNIYSDADCTTSIGVGFSRSNGSFSITSNMPSNATTAIFAKSSGKGDIVSNCVPSTLSYIEDSVIATPTLASISPVSPSQVNAITLVGTSEAGSVVGVFSDAACTIPVTSGSADIGGSYSISTSVLDNTTTQFFVKATDAATNVSSCSAPGISYVEDSLAPIVPVISSSAPVSPANNNSPTLTGAAEALSSVKIYSDAACSVLVTTLTANATGEFSFVASVTDDSVNSFYATSEDAALNVSACSTPAFVYIEDSIAPTMPVLSSLSPLSPSNSNSVTVNGTAEAESLVQLYTDAACSTALTSGTASGGTIAILTGVSDNSVTNFYATAQDAAGNTSTCSVTTLNYIEDSILPVVPTFTGVTPLSPANNNAPVLAGTAEASSGVEIYSDATCSAIVTTVTANGSGNFSYTASVVNNTTNTYFALSKDAAGNASACTSSALNYVEDSTALPPVFVSSSPVSPANNNMPVISGTTEIGAVLTIYSNAACTTSLGAATVDGSGNFTKTLSVADNSTTNLFGKITDLAGNVSTCSTPAFVFREDSTVPARPTVTSTTPASPSDNNTPFVNGAAEALSTVRIYSDNTCTTLVATGTATALAAYSVQVTAVDRVAKTYYAKAFDAAGNASTCSTTSRAYTPYTIPEGMAWLQGTTTTAAATNTNLNQATAASLRWTTASFYHSTYFAHSTATNPHQLTVLAGGDYLVSVHIPYTGATANTSVRAEVRVNGTAVDHGRLESGYLSNLGAQSESVLSGKILLSNLVANDKIDVSVILAGAAGTVTVSGRASLNVEKIDSSKEIFFAKATQTINSTNLNAAASGLSWTSEIVDSSFGHSNTSNQNQITLSSGTYLLAVNVPFTSAVANANVQIQVKKNGVLINGGKASQGYIKAAGGHNNSSAHWFGILNNVATSDVITIDTVQEAAAGTVTVPAGRTASLYIESIATNDIYVGGGNSLVTNTNWNNSTTAQLVKWTIDSLIDLAAFSHSTVTTPNRVNITNAGTYQILYRNSVSGAAVNMNVNNRLKLNNAVVSGADSKSNYISNLGGHTESSSQLNFLIRDAAAASYIEVDSYREAAAGSVLSNGDAQLVIIKKPLSLTP